MIFYPKILFKKFGLLDKKAKYRTMILKFIEQKILFLGEC